MVSDHDSFGAVRGLAIDPAIRFAAIATDFELVGGAIVNVLRYAALMAVTRTPPTILAEDIIKGIRRERRKDGQYVSQ